MLLTSGQFRHLQVFLNNVKLNLSSVFAFDQNASQTLTNFTKFKPLLKNCFLNNPSLKSSQIRKRGNKFSEEIVQYVYIFLTQLLHSCYFWMTLFFSNCRKRDFRKTKTHSTESKKLLSDISSHKCFSWEEKSQTKYWKNTFGCPLFRFASVFLI